MRFIGNVLWFVFGGFICGLLWLFAGLILCVTVIGIPYGGQCFKFAALSFFPFGKEIEYGGGVVSAAFNVIWLVFFGLWLALFHAFFGLFWCATIAGIPFGRQFFKLAKLSLFPFGARII